MNDFTPRTTPTSLQQLRAHTSTAAIVVMSFIACLGYSGVFARWTYLIPILSGVAGATVVAVIARRKNWFVGEALFVSTMAFFLIGIVVTQWPLGASSPVDFFSALANGWADLLSSQAPADLRPSLSVVPFATAWVTAAIAHELDRRIDFFGIALVGVLVGFIGTSLFSVEVRSLALVQGPLLIGLTLVLALFQRRSSEQAVRASTTRSSSPAAGISVLRAGAMLAVIGIAAATVGPRLPLVDNRERFDLRDLQDHPWDPLIEPSPLVTIKAKLKEGAKDDVLFRVTSETPILRWTQAVMTTYDGIVWQVADPAKDAPAQFVPVDSQLPRLEIPGVPASDITFDADIEIVSLDGPWVPHGGEPVSVRFADDKDLRLSLATTTLAAPDGLGTGDRFTLTTALHAAGPDDGLESSKLLLAAGSTELNLVPSPILNLAAELVEGIDFGGPQVLAIADLLAVEGYYDSGRAQPPGHSYAQIATFLDDPTRIIGYEEQYAASAAVLARAAGIPTRVVAGFLIEPGRYQDGVAEVTGDDATAWIEVLIDGSGWVPVDVTPDRNREPTDQDIGRVTRNVAVPNQPPPPPPPLDSRPVDPPEQEDEEEEDEIEDEENLDEETTLVRLLLDRPGLIAGTVALSPFLVFGLLALLAAFLKSQRRRRRRHAETTDLQVAGAWAELVDRFQEVGHTIPENAAPLEIAESLLHDDDIRPAEPAIRELVALVSRSAFAPTPPTSAEVDQAWLCAESASDVAVQELDVLERIKVRADPRPLLRPSPAAQPKGPVE